MVKFLMQRKILLEGINKYGSRNVPFFAPQKDLWLSANCVAFYKHTCENLDQEEGNVKNNLATMVGILLTS